MMRVHIDNLEWRIVANAGMHSKEGRKPRWSHVSDVTALGSGFSQEMCRRQGFDPHEEVGEPITIECDCCEGSGVVDDVPATCRNCGGEGWVLNVD